MKAMNRNKFVLQLLIALTALPLMLILAWHSALSSEAAQPSPSPTPRTGDQSVGLALPDLITLPPADLHLNQTPDLSWRVVRFDNTIGNLGPGPLEIVGVRSSHGRYQVRQRLFTTSGQLALEPLVTELEYHAAHSHWHLAEFARYELWSTNADSTLRDIVAVNGKISYCLMDTEENPNSPESPRGFILCGPSRQGISAGWLDTYHSHFPGQFLTLTGLPDGVYAIRSIVDPAHNLQEVDTSNNDAVTYFRLDARSVEVMPTPGIIWSWQRPGLAVPKDLMD
jgi:hypothetical protein